MNKTVITLLIALFLPLTSCGTRTPDVPEAPDTPKAAAGGCPFYISSIMRSGYKDKDLTTVDGLARTF